MQVSFCDERYLKDKHGYVYQKYFEKKRNVPGGWEKTLYQEQRSNSRKGVSISVRKHSKGGVGV
jgi:hypothetical protein